MHRCTRGLLSFALLPFLLLISGSVAGASAHQPALSWTPGSFWQVDASGQVYGGPLLGSTAGLHLNKPVVGMASTSDGQGYWLVAADGGVFAFGDAKFFGSMAGHPLNCRPSRNSLALPSRNSLVRRACNLVST